MKSIQGRFETLLCAVGCLLCAVAAWNSSADFIGTEFSGGSVTGRTLDASLGGAALYLVALVAIFIVPRAAGILALVASILCLPIYVYRILPRLFVQVSGGEWIDPPRAPFVCDGWSIGGVLAGVLVAWSCLRRSRQLSRHRRSAS